MKTASSSVKTVTAIGIDIGGTKIGCGLVDAKWLEAQTPSSEMDCVEGFQKADTPPKASAFLATLTRMSGEIRAKNANRTIAAIGISTAGVVDPNQGKVLGATGNVPALQEMPNLKETLEKETGLTVYVENDANAAAYGEYKIGAGRGFHNLLMVTLGTGVGTGILIDGKILHGAHFIAGEGGHIVISMQNERLCTCGRWDCWEAFASGNGLKETIHKALKASPNAKQGRLMVDRATIEDVTTYDLIAAWKEGDPLSREILDAWHKHIAVGLGSLINVLDPDGVIIGGGLAQFVDFELLTQRTLERCMPKKIRLIPATLGNHAGIVGAAFLALENVTG